MSIKTTPNKTQKKTKFDVNQAITDKFIEAIEAGTSPFQMPWSTANGMPRNVKGNGYRGINFFMTLMCCLANGWEFPVFMTYRQAKEAGYSMKKGASAVMIKFTKIIVPKEYKGNPDECPAEERIIMNKYYKVFNVADIAGIDLEQFRVNRGEDFCPIEEAEKVWLGYSNPPKYEETGVKACYAPLLDTVTMPRRDRFDSPQQFYNTLFHELTHSTGHKSRLDRNLTGKRAGENKRKDYAFEELVAELGAAFLSSHSGFLDVTFDQSASYLASWLKALKNDPKFLTDAASQAQKAVDYILGTQFS